MFTWAYGQLSGIVIAQKNRKVSHHQIRGDVLITVLSFRRWLNTTSKINYFHSEADDKPSDPIYLYFISVCLSVCLSLSVSVCLCLSLSVSVCLCLSLSVSVYLCLCLSVSLSLYLFIYLSIYLSMSICIYTYTNRNYAWVWVKTSVLVPRWRPNSSGFMNVHPPLLTHPHLIRIRIPESSDSNDIPEYF